MIEKAAPPETEQGDFLDHLSGRLEPVLRVDRAISAHHILKRSVHDASPPYFAN
jgi:hypothetical protein